MKKLNDLFKKIFREYKERETKHILKFGYAPLSKLLPKPAPCIPYRPSLPEVYMQMCEILSSRSTDEKYKVGCLITTADNYDIIGSGYNGDQIGGSNQRDSLEQGKSNFLHSELNAAIKCRVGRDVSKNVFVNWNPCLMCSKILIQLGGVQKVYYRCEYKDDLKGIELLKQNNIEVIKL